MSSCTMREINGELREASGEKKQATPPPEEDYDSGSSEEESSQLSQIKQLTQKYVNIDNVLIKKTKEHLNKIKSLKAEKKRIEALIIEALEAADSTYINFEIPGENGSLVKKVTDRKGKLSSDHVRAVLERNEGEERNIEDVMREIDETLPEKTTVVLKRCKKQQLTPNNNS